MKTKIAILALLETTSALAESFHPLTVTFSATMTINNPDVTTSGTVNIYPAPTMAKMVTTDLIQRMAVAEHNEGNWLSNSFPKGAKLVFMAAQDDFSESYFIVTDSSGNELVKVSDLMTVMAFQGEIVTSGKMDYVTDRLTKYTRNYSVYFDYSDAGAGGTTFFDLSGVVTDVITDTTKKLAVSETEKITVTSAQGSGDVNFNAATFNASIMFSGTNIIP